MVKEGLFLVAGVGVSVEPTAEYDSDTIDIRLLTQQSDRDAEINPENLSPVSDQVT